MTRSFRRRFAMVAVGMAILYVGVRLGLNYSGFCINQRRFLTDREKIELAVARILQSYPPTLVKVITYPDGRKADRWFRPEHAIPYQSVEQFLATHPDCCEVTLDENPKLGGTVSIGNRLFGLTSANVRVRYQVRYFDATGRMVTEVVEPYVAISNCGRPRA